MVKKVLAIHDLACVGRCSLTVILPILSAMGFQVCPLPTAILSSHPAGFVKVSVNDLTDNLKKINNSWKENALNFDCVYTGFLASNKQIDICEELIKEYKQNDLYIYVDPVMADDGVKYSMMNNEFVEKMKHLVALADLVTPNYTEACLLLGKKYESGNIVPESLAEWLEELAQMGPSKVVITGVKVDNDIVNVGYDKKTGVFYSVRNKKIDCKYSGTGDMFGSVLVGELLSGDGFGLAIKNASNFVGKAIERSIELGEPLREGACFEDCLGNL